MRRRFALATGFVILSGLVGIIAAAGLGQAGVSAASTFSVTGAVTAIAADGSRVAIAVRNPAGCDGAVVWTAPGTASQTYASKSSCAGVVFHGITEIAIAGNRVEWVATAGGNLQDMNLEAATVGRPQVSQVAFGENQAGAEGGVDGDWIGHVYGDGTLLVYNTWHECTLSRRQGAPPCGPEVPIGGIHYSNQTLWKLVGLTKARIRSGEDAYAAVAVDGGRVALQGARDGAVIVVDQHGHLTTSAVITAGTSAGTVMQGTQVVTLRGTTLQVWDASSGHLNGSVSLPAGTGAPVLQDLQSGLAVYLRGRAVHVVRLADSKSAAFVVPGKRAVDAQIEPAGLFYAYNLPRGSSRGRVVFVPWADLQAKLH